MVPVAIGIGIAALLIAGFSEKGEVVRYNRKTKASTNKQSKKLFISFAIEDTTYRDFLVAQARNSKSPFSFVDMSVREPWNEYQWKRRCRSRIHSCDGVLVLLSSKTWHSGGCRSEIKCATEERIDVVGMLNSKGGYAGNSSRARRQADYYMVVEESGKDNK